MGLARFAAAIWLFELLNTTLSGHELCELALWGSTLSMKVFDPKTGNTFLQKRRHRYDEPGHARELTFSCYRRFQFLSRDHTCQWFLDALEAARAKWRREKGTRPF